jgi:3-methyladenine DNA glycosylase/8-oxoguanine DNA glycosylase
MSATHTTAPPDYVPVPRSALGPARNHLPTEREMVEVAERWRPYRSLAVSYLSASGFEGGT